MIHWLDHQSCRAPDRRFSARLRAVTTSCEIFLFKLLRRLMSQRSEGKEILANLGVWD
jgi:hypothetical protein